ncbi:hypothetical protein OG811_20530 [Micromonospora sp. NBC_01638]|nr:hypothetical protein OG811_20530 [Micromonospora sp. NBC_01638]
MYGPLPVTAVVALPADTSAADTVAALLG